jgi:ectoine hydroxylase-related dioxygenase (phytanoyl-CoA dioxygenase family)
MEDNTSGWKQDFLKDGFAVVRSIISRHDIEKARMLAAEIELAWRNGESIFEDIGSHLLERNAPRHGRVLDGVQGVFHRHPPFETLRSHPAIWSMLSSRLGEDIASVVDTLFFKPPGQNDTGIAFHRDEQFRRPRAKFRDLEQSYLQLGFPLEEHSPENGGLVFLPGSHKDLSRNATQQGSVRGVENLEATLDVDADELEAVELQPGDIVIWHPYTIHGSPPNRSTAKSRKFYVVGYMSARASDLGYPIGTKA